MSTRLITFLGTGKYETTEYVWEGEKYTCQYAMVASASFTKAEQVYVFATREAQKIHEQPLRQAMPNGVELFMIEIPKGEKQEELWGIFSEVANYVSKEDTIAFDVTHGLRSFPLIGLLAAAFLRSALGIKLIAVLYGAFDVRDTSVTPPRTQMFDLTSLLTLLEWAVAADRFNRTGDSRYFASLLQQQKAILAKQTHHKSNAHEQLGDLERLSKALIEISQSLALIRPHLVMEQISQLPDKMEKSLPLLEKKIQPFRMVFDTVLETYKPLSLSNPTMNNLKNLESQRLIIKWYAEREHWVQAISLAREWLISWIMFYLDSYPFTDLSKRHLIEKTVNSEADEFIKSKKENIQFTSLFLKPIPNLEQVLGLWKNIANVRNDIDHAGMRHNPQEPEPLIKSIKKIIEQLQELPLYKASG